LAAKYSIGKNILITNLFNMNNLSKLLLLVSLFLLGAQGRAANITFRMDMSNQAVTSNVYLGGDWNGWNMAAFNMMTDANADGIYEVTVNIAPGTYNYRATIGLDWNNFENLTGSGCGAGPSGADRSVVVTNTDTVLDVYCFNSCGACSPNVNITFRVNLGSAAVSAQGVHVAGSFNGWNPTATLLTNTTGTIYEATMSLNPGTIHEYKFLNGTSWDTAEIVFGPCELSSNRYFTVPESDTVLNLVCFGYCSSDCSPLLGTRVACIGDSNTWGAGIANRYDDSYPVQLRNLLGAGYAVENFGNSGKTMLVNGDDTYWNTAQYAYSQLYSPNIVIIMLGSNDSKSWNYPAMPQQFGPDYLAMVNAYRAMPQSPQIYAVLPPKAYNAAYGIDDNVISNNIIPEIKALAYANAINIIDINHATQAMAGNFPDGVHFNATGAGIVATKDFNVLTFPKPVINQLENVLSIPGGYAFQWYLNGNPIAGATEPAYTASTTGTYRVGVKIAQATDDFLISEPLAVTALGTTNKDLLTNAVVVYPNPGKNLQLAFSNAGQYTISVISLSGQVIVSDTVNVPAGSYEMAKTSALSNGCYLIKIVSENGSTTVKKWNKY
jgi:lysophospholipase L1-like esterase